VAEKVGNHTFSTQDKVPEFHRIVTQLVNGLLKVILCCIVRNLNKEIKTSLLISPEINIQRLRFLNNQVYYLF
jgi:hypothetical protein